jgi:3-isopropylmalate dehydrogenase
MKIVTLPGDGIGPEIMQAAIAVLDATAKKFNFKVEYDEELLGGAAIDATGVPFPEKNGACGQGGGCGAVSCRRRT